MKVLLIEDDAGVAASLAAVLTQAGHDVRQACDGRLGLQQAQESGFDVLVVDRLLPRIDGVALVRALRTAQIMTPVLFLTALGGLQDKVEGLQAGGDDYLVKPFAHAEMLARVEALARRSPLHSDPDLLESGSLRIERRARRARAQGTLLDLTPCEHRVLELLMLHAGRPVTRAMLIEQALDLDADAPGSLIEPHVSRLRAKLAAVGAEEQVRTLRGLGYVLAAI